MEMKYYSSYTWFLSVNQKQAWKKYLRNWLPDFPDVRQNIYKFLQDQFTAQPAQVAQYVSDTPDSTHAVFPRICKNTVLNAVQKVFETRSV